MEISMESKEYIESRVEDQLGYYQRAANRNKNVHLRMQTGIILLALLVPVAANIQGDYLGGENTKTITITVLSLALAFLTGLANFRKFGDLWLAFRTTEELLKKELFLFRTQKGEMVPLRWTDIRSGQVVVNKALYCGVIGTPKTRRSRRVVTIGQVVESALADWRKQAEFTKPSDFVLAIRTNSPIDLHNAMARHIKPVCRKIGITDIGWHDLRHTYTTWGRRAGVPVETMRNQLGHASSVLTLDVYSHAGDDREGAVELIEQYVQACGKPRKKRNPRNPKTEPLDDFDDSEVA